MTAESQNFVFTGLETSVQLKDAATVLSEDITYTNAEFDVPAAFCVRTIDMRNVFQFSTDSTDVDSINNETDIKYFVNMEYWPFDLIINPMHASIVDLEGTGLNDNSSDGALTTENQKNNSLTQFASGKTVFKGLQTLKGGHVGLSRNMVKHEFIRYLANSLFGTAQGVDLFNNEDDLKQHLAGIGHKIWDNEPNPQTTSGIVDIANGDTNSGGDVDVIGTGLRHRLLRAKEKDGTDTEDTNFSRELLAQILANDIDRLNTSTELTVNGVKGTTCSFKNTSLMQPIPLQDFDTIQFKMTIHPSADQSTLIPTGATVNSRTYKIILLLCPDDLVGNIIPNDVVQTIENGAVTATKDPPTVTIDNSSTSGYPVVSREFNLNKSYPYSGEWQKKLGDLQGDAVIIARDANGNDVDITDTNATTTVDIVESDNLVLSMDSSTDSALAASGNTDTYAYYPVVDTGDTSLADAKTNVATNASDTEANLFKTRQTATITNDNIVTTGTDTNENSHLVSGTIQKYKYVGQP